MHNIWHLTDQDRGRPGLQHIIVFLLLTLVGTVIGSLGLVVFNVGPNIGVFWPAAALQVIGGIWFGGWGVLAGTLTGVISGTITRGAHPVMWGYIPANMLQSFLAGWVFRHWRLDPSLPTRREMGVFIFVGGFLSNLLGATLAITDLALHEGIQDVSHIRRLFITWLLANSVPCLIFGIPLLRAFSPLIIDSPFFCKTWWAGSRRLNWADWKMRDLPVSVRLLFDFGLAGLLPILVVSIAGLMDQVGMPMVSSLVLPVMISVSFFLSLIIIGRAAQKMRDRTRALGEGVRLIGEGKLADVRILDSSSDELGRLSQALNKMAEDLLMSRENLRRVTAESERNLKELQIAQDIQRSFLPREMPQLLNVEICGCCLPARLVGGDFYDVIVLDSHRIGILIADVSGKGVPAALFMALSRSLIRAYATERPTALEALSFFNKQIAGDNAAAMFVTVFFMTLERDAGHLSYINAGHNPPILIRRGMPEVSLLDDSGIALGVTMEAGISEHTIPIEPGDMLVLYTDGVTEAMNRRHDEYGLDRLIAAVRAHGNLPIGDIMQAVRDDVAVFAGDEPQSDDITLLLLRWQDRMVV